MWILGSVAFALVIALTIGIVLIATAGNKDGADSSSATFEPGVAYSGAAISLPKLDAYEISIDETGALFVSDWTTNQVRKVAPDGTVSPVAGTGTDGFSGDGGPATAAQLSSPGATITDRAGNVYISDCKNDRVRKITPNGIITTIAGNGTAGFSGDHGPATAAELNEPNGLALTENGSLYISDYNNQRIRKVTPDGIITTVAGTGTAGSAGDGGPATAAQLNNPNGISSNDGTIYISDLGNNRIRALDPDGTISTVAGGSTAGGFSGDGGPATAAALNIPSVSVTTDGVLFIGDYGNNRVRRVTTDGKISTVAGNGTAGAAGDGGPAIAATLNSPTATAVDGDGNLYIADDKNDRVRRVATDGTITTVVQLSK
jgi:serine/threonine-protein kinase